MTTLISKFTGTTNLFINIFASAFLTLIAVCLLAIIFNLIFNISLFSSASFGGF